jgi:RimJ/RimL family protein N-acetyltransferase
VIPRVQPIRSAITVAGIVGTSANNSRIRGSNTSTADPAGERTYLGGPSDPMADLTVFLEIPNRRAIALIAIPSARCNRRISAQSSTLNTPHDPLDSNESRVSHGGQHSSGDTGLAFNRRRHTRVLSVAAFSDEVIEAYDVRLRPLAEGDVTLIAQACSDSLTQKWLPLPQPYTVDTARTFALQIAPEELASGVGIERGIEVDGQFMGVIGLKQTDWSAAKTEAGYWLGPWARGRGIATRALCAITDWALETQGVGRVEVMVATGNAASLATARNAFFIEEGLLRRAGYVHEGPVDLVILSRLASDPRPGCS